MVDSGRKTARRSTFVLGTVTTPEGESITECFVRDISDSGARLQLRKDVPLPGSFVLALSKDGHDRRPCKTVWQLSIVAGVSFT